MCNSENTKGVDVFDTNTSTSTSTNTSTTTSTTTTSNYKEREEESTKINCLATNDKTSELRSGGDEKLRSGGDEKLRSHLSFGSQK